MRGLFMRFGWIREWMTGTTLVLTLEHHQGVGEPKSDLFWINSPAIYDHTISGTVIGLKLVSVHLSPEPIKKAYE
jgi:hypothetical protein